MEFILRFIFAFLFFFLLIYWLTRKNCNRLSLKELIFVFSLKVAMGCLYGWLFLRFYGGDDTWFFNRESLVEMERFRNSPQALADEVNIFLHMKMYGWSKGIFIFSQKLEFIITVFPLYLFYFFSRGDYYLNVLAFSFFGFWGYYWFYQLLLPYWSQKRSLLIAVIFLFPPSLFWLSGIRTDAWIFFFFSLLLYSFNNWLADKKPATGAIAVLAFLGMSICRLPFAALTLPVLSSWWLWKEYRFNPKNALALSLGMSVFIFFTTSIFPSPFNLPEYVVNIQQSFMSLTGNTRVNINPLEPNPISFIINGPNAILNAWLQPIPGIAKGFLQKLSFIDNVFLLILLLTAILMISSKNASRSWNHPVWSFIALYAFLVYLIIGYVIPFPGAAVRYKAIPELCWATWALNAIDWKKIIKL